MVVDTFIKIILTLSAVPVVFAGSSRLSIQIFSGKNTTFPVAQYQNYVVVHPGDLLEASCMGPEPQILAASKLNHENVFQYHGPKRICNDDDCEEPLFMDTFSTFVQVEYHGWIGCRGIGQVGENLNLDSDVVVKGVIGVKEDDVEMHQKINELKGLDWKTDEYLMQQIEVQVPSPFEHENIQWDTRDNAIRIWVPRGDDGKEQDEDDYYKESAKDVTLELIYCRSINHCKMVQICFIEECPGITPRAADCSPHGACRIQMNNDKFVGGIIKLQINGTPLFRLFFRGLDDNIYFLDQPAPADARVRMWKFSIGKFAADIVCQAARFVNSPNLRLSRLMKGQEVSFPEDVLLKKEELAFRGFRGKLTMQVGVRITPAAGEVVHLSCFIPETYTKEWTMIQVAISGRDNWTGKAILWFQDFNYWLAIATVIYLAVHGCIYICMYLYYKRRRASVVVVGDGNPQEQEQEPPQEPQPTPMPGSLPPKPPRQRTWAEVQQKRLEKLKVQQASEESARARFSPE